MKILLVSILPVNDIGSWSGICFHVHQQLSKHHTVSVCYSQEAHKHQKRLARLSRWSFKLFGKRLNVYFSLRVAKLYQRKLKQVELEVKPDIILCLGSGTEFRFHKTTTPAYLLADANWHLLKDQYPAYTNLINRDIQESERMEERSLQRFSKIFYTSQWALNSSLANYPQLRDKLRLTTFGSNVGNAEYCSVKLPNDLSDLNLLTVGKDAKRKGLDSSRTVAKHLGCNLTIVGGEIQLNKGNQKDLAKLVTYYKSAHLFLLLTRADCTPIVINEANSMGLPVIATPVGGIPEMIEEGINGYLVNNEKEAVEIIRRLADNPAEYTQLRQKTYHHYTENLTWDKFEADILSE